MRGNSHVRFGSGGGAGDRPTDRNSATRLPETARAGGWVAKGRIPANPEL